MVSKESPVSDNEDAIITQHMLDAVGVESEPRTVEVEKGAILKFAEAIGDANPLYTDEIAARKSSSGGLIAPPTFLRSISSGPPKVQIKSPYSAVLDGGSQWDYFESVRPGDQITVTTCVAKLFERSGKLGNMLFIVRETKYVNQFSQVVAIQRTTNISYQPTED